MKRSDLPASAAASATPVSRGLGWPAFLLALVTAGALAHVAVRLHSIELAYDLARQRKVQSALEEQRRRLQTEIGMLKDPNRIVALARDRLQMGPPRPEDIRRLSPGMSLRPVEVVEPAAGSGRGTGKGAQVMKTSGPRLPARPGGGAAGGLEASLGKGATREVKR